MYSLVVLKTRESGVESCIEVSIRYSPLPTLSMTTTHKKLIAIAVLGIGLLPSLPIGTADAIVPSQPELVRHCRDRLGFGQTEPVYGSLLLQLRRCIDNTRRQYQHASRLLSRTGAVHYSQYRPIHDRFRPINDERHVRSSKRSINTRAEGRERARIAYYRTVNIEDRDILLRDHRRSRRLLVQEQRHHLLRHRRAKHTRWKQAIQTCRYIVRDQRHDCVRYELTR